MNMTNFSKFCVCLSLTFFSTSAFAQNLAMPPKVGHTEAQVSGNIAKTDLNPALLQKKLDKLEAEQAELKAQLADMKSQLALVKS